LHPPLFSFLLFWAVESAVEHKPFSFVDELDA
jgi:hypothetical protein